MLANAPQNYGAIWRDSCDDTYFGFHSIPEAERNPLIQQIRMDLHKIMPHLVPPCPLLRLAHHEIEPRAMGGRHDSLYEYDTLTVPV